MPTKIIQQKIKAYRHLISKSNLFAILQSIFLERGTLEYVSHVIQQRLYNHGRDSLGRKLSTDSAGANGVYADYTIQIKRRLEERPDKRFSTWDSRTRNVTLNDYNAFYSSWQMIPGESEAWLIGDFLKDNLNTGRFSHIYENFKLMFVDKFQFEAIILDLTKQEKLSFFMNFLLPKVLNRLKNEMNRI